MRGLLWGSQIRYRIVDGAKSKKGLVNGVADPVKPLLEKVQVLVKTFLDHVLGAAEIELGPQQAEFLLGRVGERAAGGAADGVQRAVGLDQAIMNRAGERCDRSSGTR